VVRRFSNALRPVYSSGEKMRKYRHSFAQKQCHRIESKMTVCGKEFKNRSLSSPQAIPRRIFFQLEEQTPAVRLMKGLVTCADKVG
jgi:hypothetical protein